MYSFYMYSSFERMDYGCIFVQIHFYFHVTFNSILSVLCQEMVHRCIYFLSSMLML